MTLFCRTLDADAAPTSANVTEEDPKEPLSTINK